MYGQSRLSPRSAAALDRYAAVIRTEARKGLRRDRLAHQERSLAVRQEFLKRVETQNEERRPPLPPTSCRARTPHKSFHAGYLSLLREVEEVVRDDGEGDEGGIFSETSSFFELEDLELDSDSDEDELSGLQLVEGLSAMAIDCESGGDVHRGAHRSPELRS